MSGHTYTHTHIHTHIHTYTQDNYYNPLCACAPRVNNKNKFRFLQFSSDNSETVADINLILAPNYSLAWGAV